MAGFLKKKSKPEDATASSQRANSMPPQRPESMRPPSQPMNAQPISRPREPDYRPAVLSIMDQEWVHQVRSPNFALRWLTLNSGFFWCMDGRDLMSLSTGKSSWIIIITLSRHKDFQSQVRSLLSLCNW